jgi:uncharacterized protein YndB with AHSA1/START domain
MTAATRVAPVRKEITVQVPAATAFARFTERMGRWWPASHSIGSSPQRDVVIEPRPAGRWYEICEDGSESDWGEVLAWEPPGRLLLAWRLGPDWRFDPSLLTEVEVRFVPVGPEATRVELEHRLLENIGAAAEATRASIDSDEGWGALLALYAADARAAEGGRSPGG